MLKLLLVLVALGLVAFGYNASRQPAPALPTPVPAGTAVVAARVAAPTAAGGEQRLELTEQTLTDRLNQRLDGQSLGATPLGPATLTHLTAQLRNGQILTTGDAQAGALSVPVSATSSVNVQNGQALIAIQDANIAGVSVPAATRQSLQHALQDQLDQEVDQMHVRVTSVTIADGSLVAIGTPVH